MERKRTRKWRKVRGKDTRKCRKVKNKQIAAELIELTFGKIEINKKVAVFHGTEMFGEPYCHFFVLINFMLKKNPLSYI